MLDVVQESLLVGAARVNRAEVVRVAALSLLCKMGEEMIRYLMRDNNASLEVSSEKRLRAKRLTR